MPDPLQAGINQPCSTGGCVEAPGVGVFRRDFASTGSWTAIEESATHRAPIAGAGDLALDGRDLFFLRSIGIDPTRRLRRRRSSSTAT